MSNENDIYPEWLKVRQEEDELYALAHQKLPDSYFKDIDPFASEVKEDEFKFFLETYDLNNGKDTEYENKPINATVLGINVKF